MSPVSLPLEVTKPSVPLPTTLALQTDPCTSALRFPDFCVRLKAQKKRLFVFAAFRQLKSRSATGESADVHPSSLGCQHAHALHMQTANSVPPQQTRTPPLEASPAPL